MQLTTPTGMSSVPPPIVRRLLAAVSLVTAPLLPAAAEGLSSPHERVVVVLALPGSMGEKITSDTERLVSEIASGLRAAGVQVVVAGVGARLSLEELTATTNATDPDMTLGVRSLGGSSGCAAVITPGPPPKAPPSVWATDTGQLRELIRQIGAASRAETSNSLATVVASVVRCCSRKPTETEQYILDATGTPTVILTINARDADALLPHIPAVFGRLFALDQK